MIVILGAGESGTGAALLAQAKGYDVFVSERGTLAEKYRQVLQEHHIPFEEGGHTEEKILAAELVIKSPGIPDKAPLVQQLKAQGTPILDELEWASRFTDATLVAITGSNGKTTTTLLTHHLLTHAALPYGLAGNVGQSLAKQVTAGHQPGYVVEMSSFQLDHIEAFRPRVAVLLNITPDHLDRYEYKFEKYIDSKFRITENQTADDFLIYYQEDPVVREELAKRSVAAALLPVSLADVLPEGAFVEGTDLRIKVGKTDWRFAIDALPIKGKHNLINAGAALLAVALLGADEARVRQGLQTFRNAPHRLEDAGTVQGVRFINDSKATNVDSVKYALDAVPAPIVWIAGGVDKGNDYGQIADLVRAKVKALVCMGTDNQPLQKAFGSFGMLVRETASMADALRVAFAEAAAGDTVLLSPACASFDLFRNYEDRGEQFKAQVQQLQSTQTTTPS
ncbi:UDP-N-acetylmuramoylalanine--D-glutamate ligase [Catalinimonas alkaloidigena]|uniref:UDP-N-acetylmuramoylalanine--D-glutamate ligase n=1 Tax=Catalinimonas alkaloidigena TaxID=1075417 RepID=A0A1G9JAW8_9BACT|nr:UDP-N-acetylmuramoyl-L-alanine--D-glutamate ligase [Catalinimonas alkaloidigena]SDL34356.1 UDP-N-acetylmuramoylalanine--D-glutamate ligase [Catalinimonas alkaloidigena]